MNNRRSTLEDLIWKGSQLPNKFKFANRTEIKSDLQKLDDRWQYAKKWLDDKIEKTSTTLEEWQGYHIASALLKTWLTESNSNVKEEEFVQFPAECSLSETLNNLQVTLQFSFVLFEFLLMKCFTYGRFEVLMLFII